LFVYRDLWAWIDPTTAGTRKIVRAVDAATDLSGSVDWTAAISHMPTIRRNFQISRSGIWTASDQEKRLATANLPRVQLSESEFCPYSGDVGDQFLANLDSSD
jgi:hypothetical protein